MAARDRHSHQGALQALASALAPYLLEEVRLLLSEADQRLDPRYDEKTCNVFVEGLGDQVLERGLELFSLLDSRHIVDSVTLAAALDVAPRAISGHLTTPLKRRAKALTLPFPFLGGEGARPDSGLPEPLPGVDTSRTHWQDRDGIAARMVRALCTELTARRRRLAESRMFEGEPMHTRNDALISSQTDAIGSGTDSEIWVFANTFQGYDIFGHDRLIDFTGEAVGRWQERQQVPSSLTLLRAVLFARARQERFTDYDEPAWADHKWYMRVLARRVAAHVRASDLEDEYETAVAWIRATPAERQLLWEEVTEDEAQTKQPTQPGATFDWDPSTFPENQDLVQLIRDRSERGDEDG